MGLLLQPNAKYGPIFKATTELLFLCATWIWEASGALHELQLAWQSMRAKMARAGPRSVGP
eukprot:6882504-Pyramimonas_sp.AAC.1